MRFEGITFFIDDKGPLFDPVVNLTYPEENYGWPISINIGTKLNNRKVSIHLKSETQLIQFVNSVKSSYNNYRKDKGYDR